MTLFDRLFKWAWITVCIVGAAAFLFALWTMYHEDPKWFFVVIAAGVACGHASLLYITAAMVYDTHQKVNRLERRCDE